MADEQLQQLADDLRSTWEEFKNVNAQAEEQVKKLGTETAETKQEQERIQERLDEIEVRMTKVAEEASATPARDGEPSIEQTAFRSYVRRGEDKMEHELRASLQVGDDTEGGYLAPSEDVGEIIKGIQEFSPIRSIARVRSTTRRSVRVPKRTQVAGAVWVGETDPRTETQNPKYGLEEVSTRELSAMADVSVQDLEDTAFDLESEVYGEFSEQFGVAEGAAFVAGDGVDGKPEGFLVHPDVELVASTTNDVVSADDFINVYYALKDAYAKNASWVMRRSTIRDARKLKDTQNNYLWQPGLAGLAPATILDQPYVEAKDMPAIADQAKAVAFGDFRRAYVVVDRIQIATLRDPYTQAGNGNVRLWARKRVGGQVMLAEALKILRIA